MLSVTMNAPESAFDSGTEKGFLSGDLDDLLSPMHASQRYVGMTGLPTYAIHDIFNADIPEAFQRYKQHLEMVWPL